jgi:hypothetical protein
MSPPPPQKWKQTGNVPGPPRPGPVIKVKGPTLTLRSVKFQNTVMMYRNSSTHALAKGDMEKWARGIPIVEPEWMATRKEQFPAAVLRKTKPAFVATLSWPTKTEVSGSLIVDATLDKEHLITVAVPFTIKAGEEFPTVLVDLVDEMPDEVGRYKLAVTWDAQPAKDPSDFDFPQTSTQHDLFAVYDTPYLSDSDSAAPSFTGVHASGLFTITGTQQRFDQLMGLFGVSRRHLAATPDDIRELLWRVHTGVNEFQNPPFFDAIHDRYLTVDGGPTKHYDETQHAIVGSDPLSTNDQWLMWLRTTAPHWNSAACIGYVQLIKTMMAAVGIFVRRAWVIPHTRVLPDGTTATFKDEDLWCLGEEDSSKWQTASLRDNKGAIRTGTLALVEPNRGGERFEACLYTPDKHFLPGGYQPSKVDAGAPGFIKGRGFASALDLLRWWCKTKRQAFQRFQCWVDLDNLDGDGKPTNFWDREGTYYAGDTYVNIVKRGKEVPPP